MFLPVGSLSSENLVAGFDPRIARLITLVRAAISSLPTVDISLSRAIRDGKDSFKAAGGDNAYFGHPATASASHGEEQYALLASAIVRDVVALLGPSA